MHPTDRPNSPPLPPTAQHPTLNVRAAAPAAPIVRFPDPAPRTSERDEDAERWDGLG